MYHLTPRTKLNYNFDAKLQPYSIRFMIGIIVVQLCFSTIPTACYFPSPNVFFTWKRRGFGTMEGFCKRKTLSGRFSLRIIRSMQMAWDFANRTAATGNPVDVFTVAALTTMDILPVFSFPSRLRFFYFTYYIVLYFSFYLSSVFWNAFGLRVVPFASMPLSYLTVFIRTWIYLKTKTRIHR